MKVGATAGAAKVGVEWEAEQRVAAPDPPYSISRLCARSCQPVAGRPELRRDTPIPSRISVDADGDLASPAFEALLRRVVVRRTKGD